MSAPDDGRVPGTQAPKGAPRLIERYEAIAQASRSMLSAARRGDWDEVERLQARCRDLIAALRAAHRTERLGAAEQRRRLELLRRILADDAEIRARAEPWLRQLERLIGAPRTRRARA